MYGRRGLQTEIVEWGIGCLGENGGRGGPTNGYKMLEGRLTCDTVYLG